MPASASTSFFSGHGIGSQPLTIDDGFPRGWVDKNHLNAVREAVKRFVNDAKAEGS